MFNDKEDNPDGFRHIVMEVSIILPLVCLFIEMLFNNIRIPINQWIMIVVVNFCYILTTWVGQRLESLTYFPFYPSNLNWNCDSNWAFIYDDTVPKKPWIRFYNNTCDFFEKYNTDAS